MRFVRAVLGSVLVVLVLVGFPTSAGAQTTGPQRVTIVIRQDFAQDQPTFSRVVATGVITALGTDVFLPSPEGDPASYSRYEFPDGTLLVRNTPEQEEFTLNPNSCVGKLEASGRWEVLGGTGAYADAEGSGTLTVSGTVFLDRVPEGCSETEGTLNGVIKITGEVTLPA
jgi:hypothetical protein